VVLDYMHHKVNIIIIYLIYLYIIYLVLLR